MAIGSFYFFDDSEEFRVSVFGAFCGAAFKVPLGHLGVERFTVVEVDTRAQFEGVDLAVR